MRIGDKVCFFSTTYVKEIKRLFKEADTDGSGSPDLRALRAIFFQLVNSQVVPQCKLEVNLEKFFLVTESFFLLSGVDWREFLSWIINGTALKGPTKTIRLS